MSACIPRMTYEEVIRLLINHNLVFRMSEVTPKDEGFCFRARVINPPIANPPSYEAIISLTHQQYIDGPLPPTVGWILPTQRITKEDS